MPSHDTPILALALVALAGCGSACDATSDLTLDDANNYAFDGALDIRSTPLPSGSDPVFDWSGLTTDLQGHPLDPVDDIDNVAVIAFWSLTHAEVEAGLSTDSLAQEDLAVFVAYEPGDATSAHLSQLTLLGNDIDVEQYFEVGYAETWMLTVTTGTVPGVGTRMAAFLEPTEVDAATTLTLADGDTVLDFTADLSSLTPVQVPADEPALTLTWDTPTRDAQGGDLDPTSVDQVMIGRYDGLTPADLEARFLDLELIADATWTMDVDAVAPLDLSEATGADGSFPGITGGDAAWVLALRCTTCANPAPPFLTLLQACD